jgi:hypothetical protein
MVRTCEKKNENELPARCERNQRVVFVDTFPECIGAGLISPNLASHDKHFIVMPHNSHVTIKWAGRAATLPTLKGDRTHGRNKLLTGKIREDHAF